MGMIAILRQVTPGELREIQSNPSGMYQRLFGRVSEESTALLERMRHLEEKYRKTGVFERLQKAGGQGLDKADQELLRQRNEEFFALAGQIRETGSAVGFKHEELSLEKSWHQLHFLLTGRVEGGSPPIADAILGGEQIPDTNKTMAFGPARFLTPSQVRSVAQALAGISTEELASRFDVARMRAAQIYAVGIHEDLDDLLGYFTNLKDYYTEAASLGNGMLLYIG